MVDFRPLLFVNALALMLLVTAGFASVRDDLQITEAFEPPSTDQAVASITTEPEPAPEPVPEASARTKQAARESRPPVVEATPFTVPSMPEKGAAWRGPGLRRTLLPGAKSSPGTMSG